MSETAIRCACCNRESRHWCVVHGEKVCGRCDGKWWE